MDGEEKEIKDKAVGKLPSESLISETARSRKCRDGFGGNVHLENAEDSLGNF